MALTASFMFVSHAQGEELTREDGLSRLPAPYRTFYLLYERNISSLKEEITKTINSKPFASPDPTMDPPDRATERATPPTASPPQTKLPPPDPPTDQPDRATERASPPRATPPTATPPETRLPPPDPPTDPTTVYVYSLDSMRVRQTPVVRQQSQCRATLSHYL